MEVTLIWLINEIESLNDDFLNLADWIEENDIYDFKETILDIIKARAIVQEFWQETLEKNYAIDIPDNTKLSTHTLNEINKEFQETLSEDKIYANFSHFVDDYRRWYWEIFDQLSEVFDNEWFEWFKYYVNENKLIENYEKNNPLINFIDNVLNWDNPSVSIMKVFEKFGVNINQNPIVTLDKQVEFFINKIQELIFWKILDNKNFVSWSGNLLLN